MSLFSLDAKLGLDSSAYEKGLEEAEGKATSFGSKLGSGLKSAAKIGATAIGAATAAASAFGLASLKTGSEFDSAMSQVAATLGFTTDEIKNNVDKNGVKAGDTFDALRKKAQEMGAATNFSASQAAEGLNILAMSGFSAEDSISMVEDVLHLAAAGSMDMASAAGYVSGTLKGFGASSKDAGKYADLMAKGATLANTSVAQLGEAMSSGAAGAAAYGQTADSMTLALLRLAEQGDVGAAAGTALSAAMKNLYTPTDQAKKAMLELGVAAYDQSGKARDFNDVVNDLQKSMSGMTAQQQANYKSTIFGIQGLDAYNKMTVTGIAKQNEWAEALSHASDGAGETAKQYETMTDNLKGDLDILSSAFDGLKIAVSDTLMGTAREFVKFGSDSLAAITEGFQNGDIAGAMEALGGVLSDGISMIFEKLPMVVDAGVSLLKALVQGIVDSAPMLIQSALDIVLMLGSTLRENIQPLAEAAISIIYSLAAWIGEYSTVLIETAVEIILTLANALTDPDNIGKIIDSAIFLVLSLAEGLISAVPHLIEAVPVLIENIVTTVSKNLPKILESGIELVEMLVQGFIDNIPLVVESFTKILETITTFITEHLPEILESGIDLLIAIMDGIVDAIPQLVEALPKVIEAIVNFVTQNLPVIIQTGITLLMKLAEGIIQNLPAIIQAMSTILTNLVQYIAANLPMIIQSGISLLMAIIEGMIDHLPDIIQATIDVVLAIVDALLDNLDLLIEAAIEIIVALAGGLVEAIPKLIAKIPEIIEAVINAFLETDWLDVGRQIIEGIGNGIVNFASGLWQKAKDAAKGALDGIKNFLGIHSPSRVFRDQVGKMIGMGLAEGIDKSAAEAVKSAESMAEDVLGGVEPIADLSGDLTANLASGNGYGADAAGMASNRSVVINVYGAEGQNVNELAEIISEKIAFGYNQERMAWA